MIYKEEQNLTRACTTQTRKSFWESLYVNDDSPDLTDFFE